SACSSGRRCRRSKRHCRQKRRCCPLRPRRKSRRSEQQKEAKRSVVRATAHEDESEETEAQQRERARLGHTRRLRDEAHRSAVAREQTTRIAGDEQRVRARRQAGKREVPRREIEVEVCVRGERN